MAPGKVKRPVLIHEVPGCVFDDEHKAFVSSDGDMFLFDPQTEVVNAGVPIPLKEIGDGSQANITFDNKESRVLKIDLTLFKARRSQLMLFREGLVVFSRKMFPTNLLLHEVSDETRFPVQVISDKFPAIRKVNSMNGNGFWTAVGVAYLEHISLPAVQVTEFDSFLVAVQENDPQNGSVLEALQDLRRYRETIGLQWIEDKCDDRDFQVSLVRLIKRLSISFVESFPTHPVALMCEDAENAILYEEELGQEVQCLVALALKVRLVVYAPDLQPAKMSFECEGEMSAFPYIYLFLQNGSYHILYSEAKLKAQGYDLIQGTRSPPQNVIYSQGTLKALYYTPKQREEIEATTRKAEMEHTILEVQEHVRLNESAQNAIANTFDFLKRSGLNIGFFDDDLVSKANELIETYPISLKKLRKGDSAILTYVKQVELLETKNTFENCYVAMNLCDYCQNSSAFWMLSCKHVLCKKCISEHINKARDTFPFIVTPSGLPVPELICPITSCKRQFTKENLQLLIGEEAFQEVVTDAENITLRKQCSLCLHEQEKELFLMNHYCACKICLICLADLVRRHDSVCVCGKQIPSTVVSIARSYKMQCSACKAARGLLDHFTHQICEDHLICRECLEDAFKTEGRCPVCYYQYSETQKSQLQLYFLKKCQLGCGRAFQSGQALKLQCRCHYCLECAKKEAENTLQFGKCFICSVPMPRETVNLFSNLAFQLLEQNHMLTETVHKVTYRAPECPICLSRIGLNSMADLACPHTLHKDCLIKHLESAVDMVITKEITCPVPSCLTLIPGNLINTYLDARRFNKYSEALINLQLKMRTCQKCKFQFEMKDVVGPDMMRIVCPVAKCNYTFCSSCGKPWGQVHDQKLCRFNEIQEQILVLEAEGGQNKKVSQCPGCQTPYLKDDACEHVRCANSQCLADWCFECSAFRGPIIAHHNEWHRPSCRFYEKPLGKDVEVMKKNCPECKRLGKRCDPPKDLKVPRRFAIDEYQR